MSAKTIGQFMDYFECFEAALQTGNWRLVGECFAEDARYSVEGVPFACCVKGREAISQAFQKSTSAFDATMDYRLLDIQSITRIAQNRIRVDLISGYGREETGAMTTSVAMEVEVSDRGIERLRDIYDPQLTLPALAWLAANFDDADPSYV